MEHLKNMTKQKVSEFMSYEICDGQKFRRNPNVDIFAYPQNNVREIAKIMTDIRIDCLPVLASPWNKKLTGFIKLSQIKVFLD